MAGLAVYIPPIAKYAMDGAPGRLWLFEEEDKKQDKDNGSRELTGWLG
jgi:hypothetical protein